MFFISWELLFVMSFSIDEKVVRKLSFLIFRVDCEFVYLFIFLVKIVRYFVDVGDGDDLGRVFIFEYFCGEDK